MPIVSREEIGRALKKMKTGKAPGPSGVVTEMLKASEEVSVEWLTELCNSVLLIITINCPLIK